MATCTDIMEEAAVSSSDSAEMMTFSSSSSEASAATLLAEFEAWQKETSSNLIFFLNNEEKEDGTVVMRMLLASDNEFKLFCPMGYSKNRGSSDNFFVESSGTAVRLWSNALNEYLLDCPKTLRLTDVLTKAVALYGSEDQRLAEESDSWSCDEAEDDAIMMSDDDDTFTTKQELDIARKKKRWALKEEELRQEMKRQKTDKTSSSAAATAYTTEEDFRTRQDQSQVQQIFSNSAASGVLVNDLVSIMETIEELGFAVEPINDNIYKWSVKMYDFEPSSDLAADLAKVNSKFGYNHIELEMDFAIDLYPFYPPLVKVVRPRLQDSMMQRVTNMEILKLSFWNPAKDMKAILSDIRRYLQDWARLEVESQRNSAQFYPHGAYIEIEQYLLRLALVSEINPRANLRYHIQIEKVPEIRISEEDARKKVEYWQRGVGFGHNKRPGWDIAAYLAAQKEKDKQIVAVLYHIIDQLSKLSLRVASTAERGRGGSSGSSSSGVSSGSGSDGAVADRCCVNGDVLAGSSTSCACANGSVGSGQAGELRPLDIITDVYSIIEGSALVPFLESYLKDVSFLEICRHVQLYKAILEVCKELASQSGLAPLLCQLPNQQTSIYHLLKVLHQQATLLMSKLHKPANGSVPGIHEKKKEKKENKFKQARELIPCIMVEESSSANEASAAPVDRRYRTPQRPETAPLSEEKLAREFVSLFELVTEAVKATKRENSQVSYGDGGNGGGGDDGGMEVNGDVDMVEVAVEANPNRPPDDKSDEELSTESKYINSLKSLQFDSCEISVKGNDALVPPHYFSRNFNENAVLPPTLVFRLAQELTSMSTSLPLTFSSSIFVRNDDDKMNLTRALITGPEGTPYSCGCFIFDIYFPDTYPKVPPKVNLQTTGNGQVRFNPNLYASGKVCLSLLGTWEGQGGEKWTAESSTVLQVLVSIQSLILVPEPYFNEPGFETEIGTDKGRKHSLSYNQEIRIATIKHAMIGLLQKPCPGFKEVIETHFFLKKKRVLEECNSWMQETPKDTKLQQVVSQLKSILEALQCPSGILKT